MLLIDLGNSLEEPLEEAKILLKNQCQFCSIFAARESDCDKSPKELLGLVELEWTS